MAEGYLDRFEESVLGLQDSLAEFQERQKKEALGEWKGIPYSSPSDQDIPSPSNPLRYPSKELEDLVRHYYGPMIMAEKYDPFTSYIAALWHEIEAIPAGEEERRNIPSDLWNNFVSLWDYFEKGKEFGRGVGYELDPMLGDIDPGMFEGLANIALEANVGGRKTMMPPKSETQGSY